MTFIRDKFDFEIGYLVKSPCKSCTNQSILPRCSDNCYKLNQVQSVLARGISCSKNFPSSEPYSISHQGIKQK